MTKPNTSPLSRMRDERLKWIACAVLFVVSYYVFYLLCLRPSSDISIHATWAAEGDFLAPRTFLRHGAHPMWHVPVAFLLLFSVPLPVAAALVTAITKAIEFLLVYRLCRTYLSNRMNDGALTLLSLACVTVSCLCVPGYNNTVYLGVGTPNTWHSCTQLMAMVWMLLCVPYTAKCYDEFERLLPTQGEKTILPWRMPVLLGGMLFLSLLAKPTFMQAFLPAACLFFLVKWIKHPKNSRFFWQIIVCVLPSVLFMIVQYMYYFGIIVPSQGSMIIQVSLKKLWDVTLRTVLMQAFPIYVMVAFRKAQKHDTLFWLTLVFDAVGIVEFLILGESGRRAADGNFGWGMMGAALMMWVIAAIRFAWAVWNERVPKERPKRIAGWALLLWHVASGLYYVVYLVVSGASL